MRLAALFLSSTVLAQVDVAFSGSVSADLRYRVQERRERGQEDGRLLLEKGFTRNENRLRAKVIASVQDKLKGVGEIEFVWMGFSNPSTLADLTRREEVDPYWVEAQAAYLDIYNLAPNLDLRIGRQVVKWGTADQFNPTDTMNPMDLYDPLQFGVSLANQMVRTDWHPHERFTLTAVWVPVFRPARLPLESTTALGSFDRLPVQNTAFRHEVWGLIGTFLGDEEGGGLSLGEILVSPQLPPADHKSTQAGVRLATKISDFDLFLSYYIGRDDIPQPYLVDARDLDNVSVALMYPRVQVVGLATSASLPWLADLGFWAEGAVFFPQKITMSFLTPEEFTDGEIRVAPDGGVCGLGEACTLEARDPTIVDSKPFPKWTVGLDYTFTETLYANAQWVHGLVDEFGTGTDVRVAAGTAEEEHLRPRIGDYAVANIDWRPGYFRDAVLLRLSDIFSLNDHSTTLFPQVAWSIWDSGELSSGIFIKLGDFDTKFGDPGGGATEAFVKAKLFF